MVEKFWGVFWQWWWGITIWYYASGSISSGPHLKKRANLATWNFWPHNLFDHLLSSVDNAVSMHFNFNTIYKVANCTRILLAISAHLKWFGLQSVGLILPFVPFKKCCYQLLSRLSVLSHVPFYTQFQSVNRGFFFSYSREWSPVLFYSSRSPAAAAAAPLKFKSVHIALADLCYICNLAQWPCCVPLVFIWLRSVCSVSNSS